MAVVAVQGDTSERWQSIQEQIAQITRVCTYDRAGYGLSEPDPMPHHNQQIADELRLLLDKAGVQSPYLLVGHSLGGINVQLFANRYPDLVAGLILLDPAPLSFITRQAFPKLYQMFEQEAANLQQMAETARQSTDAEMQVRANYLAAVASEHTAPTTESASQVAEIEALGDIPLVIIGAGKPNLAFGEAAETFQQFWNEQSMALALKSTNGAFMLAQKSGHHLHEDVPDLVLDAIRQMVERPK